MNVTPAKASALVPSVFVSKTLPVINAFGAFTLTAVVSPATTLKIIGSTFNSKAVGALISTKLYEPGCRFSTKIAPNASVRKIGKRTEPSELSSLNSAPANVSFALSSLNLVNTTEPSFKFSAVTFVTSVCFSVIVKGIGLVIF